MLRVEAGSLYPALHRMTEAGLLSAEWRMSEAGRRGRFYALTDKGRRKLETAGKKWRAVSARQSPRCCGRHNRALIDPMTALREE